MADYEAEQGDSAFESVACHTPQHSTEQSCDCSQQSEPSDSEAVFTASHDQAESDDRDATCDGDESDQADSQPSLERRCSRGRLLSKQNEIEEVDEDHSPSSETSDATVVAAGLETPSNDASPESSPTEKTKNDDSSPDADRPNQRQGRRNSEGKNKILVRSHALRDDTSPPPSDERLPAPLVNNHSSSPNTLAPMSKSSPRRKLEKSGSQNSDVSGTSPCLSRDSSIETQYTDATGIDLEEFIRSTLTNNPKDRIMLLKLEQDLTAFIKDAKKDIHKFQSMTSYHRMLVHRVAAFFGLEHNVDQTGKAVIVNKTVNTRIPDFKFRDHIREDSLSLDEPKKLLKRGDSASFEDGKESASSQEGAIDSPGSRPNTRRSSLSSSKDGELMWSGDVQPWSSTDSSGYGTDCSGRVHLSMTKASSFGGVTVLSRGERTRVYKSVSVESKTVGTCTSPCPLQQLLPPPLEVNPTVLWVALQQDSVPLGSVIINPATGQPYFNCDGSVYRFSPGHPQQPWQQQCISPSSSISSMGSSGHLSAHQSLHGQLRPQQQVPRQYSGESNGSHDLNAPFSSMSLTSQSSTESDSGMSPYQLPLPTHQLPQHHKQQQQQQHFTSPHHQQQQQQQQPPPPQQQQQPQAQHHQLTQQTSQVTHLQCPVSGVSTCAGQQQQQMNLVQQQQQQQQQSQSYPFQPQLSYYGAPQQMGATQYYVPLQQPQQPQQLQPPPGQQQVQSSLADSTAQYQSSLYAGPPTSSYGDASGLYYPYHQSPTTETSQFYAYQATRATTAATPPAQQQQQQQQQSVAPQPFYQQAVYAAVSPYQTKAATATGQQGGPGAQALVNKPPHGYQPTFSAYPVPQPRANSPQVITFQNLTSPTQVSMVRPGITMQVPQRTTPPPNLQLPPSGMKIVYDRNNKAEMVYCSDGQMASGSATPPIQSPQHPFPNVQLPARATGMISVTGTVPGGPSDLRFYGAPIQLRPQIQPLFTARPTRFAAPIVATNTTLVRNTSGQAKSQSGSDSSSSSSRSSSAGQQKSMTSPQHESGEVIHTGHQLLEVYDLPSQLKCQDLDMYLEGMVAQGGKIHCIPPDEPNRALSDCVVLVEFASPLVVQSLLVAAQNATACGQTTGFKLRPCLQQVNSAKS